MDDDSRSSPLPRKPSFPAFAGAGSAQAGIRNVGIRYLETLDWDKTPPAPPLPVGIVEQTSCKYREASDRITGAPSRSG